MVRYPNRSFARQGPDVLGANAILVAFWRCFQPAGCSANGIAPMHIRAGLTAGPAEVDKWFAFLSQVLGPVDVRSDIALASAWLRYSARSCSRIPVVLALSLVFHASLQRHVLDLHRFAPVVKCC